MLISFLLFLLASCVYLLAGFFTLLSFVFQIPYIMSQFGAAVSYFLAPVYYWNGLFDVTAVLNFLGYVMGWYYVIFVFNTVMYIWSKIPWLGRPTAFSSDKRT